MAKATIAKVLILNMEFFPFFSAFWPPVTIFLRLEQPDIGVRCFSRVSPCIRDAIAHQ
jgi:hypothetical protein